MSTQVFGTSDDLIEFEGDVCGEVGFIGTDDEKSAALLVFSDGTVLTIRYGKGGDGIWWIRALRKGDLFERIDECSDEEASRYSDTAHFKDGMKWAYAATRWEKAA